MDSMSADLMPALETKYAYFDKERFLETLASGGINDAEAYLSLFTKFDSNFHSNMMFYLVQRQKFFTSLANQQFAMAGFFMLDGGRDRSIPETKDFIDNDSRRCLEWGREYERGVRGSRPALDIHPVSKCFMKDMLEMMHYLVALNPDLQKNDNTSRMETLRL